MSRKTIQPSPSFNAAVQYIRDALRNHRLWVNRYRVEPVQSGPPPTPSKTAITHLGLDQPIQGLSSHWQSGAFRVLDQNLDLVFSTEDLKQSLESQIVNKTGDVVSGVKASELRAIALQSQVLNGLRRRGSKRQLNRLDRIARAGYRRELLAHNDGPLQSVLVKRVEDTLARVNSSD